MYVSLPLYYFSAVTDVCYLFNALGYCQENAVCYEKEPLTPACKLGDLQCSHTAIVCFLLFSFILADLIETQGRAPFLVELQFGTALGVGIPLVCEFLDPPLDQFRFKPNGVVHRTILGLCWIILDLLRTKYCLLCEFV